MTSTFICAASAVLVSFTAAWLLARLAIETLIQCLPHSRVPVGVRVAAGRGRP